MLVNTKTVVIVSGGFDPIHSGHIQYINEAKKLGDILYVAANTDEWLTKKKGKPFLNWTERATILSNLKTVDFIIEFDDSDGSAKDAILHIRERNPLAKIIFANGGDRTKNNIPEMDLKDDNLEFVFGVGGETKANSSSWILKNWKDE
jgi:D-beta-D-heptose 7-phosphate kinase/D-beta-D-heptose 1-phosphate adenosyltransferase